MTAESPRSPATANVAPGSPEATLRASMDDLVRGAFAHYEALPSRSDTAANPYAPERIVETHNYRDGTQRQHITDGSDGSVEDKLHLSHAVMDQFDRRVLLVTKTYPDGRVERDLRFLPSRKRLEKAYRWSADMPVSELDGEKTHPLVPNTPEFNEAWHLGGQVAARLGVLREHQRPTTGSIRVAKAGAGLVGTLARVVARRRSE